MSDWDLALREMITYIDNLIQATITIVRALDWTQFIPLLFKCRYLHVNLWADTRDALCDFILENPAKSATLAHNK